jgi:hypothetical protein
VIQEVRLRGGLAGEVYAPPEPVGHLIQQVPAVVGMAVRMAFRGRSNARGPRPGWLKAMTDVRFVNAAGGDETVVRFEVPCFGEVAGELYRQLEFWPSRPDQEDTGFDLLGDILVDLAEQRDDSDHFDAPLLKRLGRFGNVVNGCYQEMLVTGRRYRPAQPARLTETSLVTARSFVEVTPPETPSRLVGVLDMIRASMNSFALKLDDGTEVRGVLDDGRIADFRNLVNERVEVCGKAVFRASGRLLRVDADSVEAAPNGLAVWSKVPRPRAAVLDVASLRQPQTPRSGLAAIIGKWPGEETDEEVATALRELS